MCAAALPCASGYHRGTHTDRAGHALRLYHGTHPTQGAQSLTARLSDGYRHNVPHPPSDRLQRAAQIHTGHTEPHSAPQRWLPAQCTTHTIGQPQRAAQIHTGHTEPHSAPQPLQMACAAALHHDSRTDPHSTGRGSTMVHTHHRAHRASQTASAMATGTIYHTHHRTASASRKKLYTEYIKYILQLFFFPSKIAETFSRICK